jgi:secernin
MCDSLCVLPAHGRSRSAPNSDGDRALFAKNSDRPVGELQVLRSYPKRPAGGDLRTQYLAIPDTGAMPVVLSQPTWLWGAEHGVNARHVAIGNEKVYGTADPYAEPQGLIGMDLVRLGLERGRSASEAIDVITDLLETYGQGGIADASTCEPYWSSFLVVDPVTGWILETCGRTWVAKPVESAGAISNRLSIRTEWARASADVEPGSDFDEWRNPDAPTGHADRRLAASEAYLASAVALASATASSAAAHLRDHGSGPWGAPGSGDAAVEPPPRARPDGTGVTVCMHVRGFSVTAASMVAELPEDEEKPATIWAAAGSPCASVYLPVVLPAAQHGDTALIPSLLGEESFAARLAGLREAVEREPGLLASVRGDGPTGFDALESSVWREAEELIRSGGRSSGPGPSDAWDRFYLSIEERFAKALARLETR